ncbi:BirA family biotin operon repressor/biotin-[acetyl-CoA-carboxylase] ligase [Microbacterium resistens]|uniref:biotin--[biotin carboxyl-carrier protein] ligase n=1 Tax=Microbacterium resistens TaxID=156977 RepID=A0ABU1S9K4_9MICO|nr:biotin--[acetyl-CoA-carboxylase] ligase [Microbacterium resistens]MDR6866293.1 BirA family biotin operon repressor/biotin-[acetyl-CoA-carboxylase] ligase [Microbacterium resistens]
MSYPHSSAAASRLEEIPSTGSTNADLLARAADADEWPHLSVLLTEDQRAGRGRLERSWVAPAGSALAVSVLLRVSDVPLAERGWIPLAAGLAMAEAVSAQLPRAAVGVKWPNDVLVGGRKICGILAEAAGADVVVVGAGVNTAMTAEQLPVPTATSFAVEGASCDRDLLVAGYIARLDGLLAALAEYGSAVASGLRDRVAARCLTVGQEVRVSLPGGGEILGRATGLAEDGRIRVVDATGERAIAAGDIVHLRAL